MPNPEPNTIMVTIGWKIKYEYLPDLCRHVVHVTAFSTLDPTNPASVDMQLDDLVVQQCFNGKLDEALKMIMHDGMQAVQKKLDPLMPPLVTPKKKQKLPFVFR